MNIITVLSLIWLAGVLLMPIVFSSIVDADTARDFLSFGALFFWPLTLIILLVIALMRRRLNRDCYFRRIELLEKLKAYKASGNMSHAEGTGTTVFGQNAHAEGKDTVVSGMYKTK